MCVLGGVRLLMDRDVPGGDETFCCDVFRTLACWRVVRQRLVSVGTKGWVMFQASERASDMNLMDYFSKPLRECEAHRAKGTVFVLMSETRQSDAGYLNLT